MVNKLKTLEVANAGSGEMGTTKTLRYRCGGSGGGYYAAIAIPLCGHGSSNNNNNHDRHKKYSPSIYHNKLSSSWNGDDRSSSSSDTRCDSHGCGCGTGCRNNGDSDDACGNGMASDSGDGNCSNSISVRDSCCSDDGAYGWMVGCSRQNEIDDASNDSGGQSAHRNCCGRQRRRQRRRLRCVRWPFDGDRWSWWSLMLLVTAVMAIGGSGGGGGGGGGLTIDTVAAIADGNDGGSMMGDGGGNGVFTARYSEKIGNLEKSIAAVFNKVAYGSTTTKRSIPDNVFVPSLTTVPTPPLTTFRYREREKDQTDDSGGGGVPPSGGGRHHQQQQQQQQINLYHRNYELDLERDHALPTSAPNADILKSNSNPTYPNPNRHNHNHDHDRHRHNINSTPAPSVHNLLKKGPPTIPMYSGDMPSYSPPARSFFTQRIPSDFQNPFADKPTLRGTNSDSIIYGGGGGGGGNGGSGGTVGGNGGIVGGGGGGGSAIGGGSLNRRPIPPPSLMPGQERIPYRPPDLVGGAQSPKISDIDVPAQPHQHGGKAVGQSPEQRKKALNTPAQNKHNRVDLSGLDGSGSSGNFTDPLPNSSVMHFPSISRILSGSNGRKEDIPEVLLRTVTARPHFHQQQHQPIVVPGTDPGGGTTNLNNDRDGELDDVDNDDDDDDDEEDEDDADDEDVDEETDGVANNAGGANEHVNHRDSADDDGAFGMFPPGTQDEPKTQPKTKQVPPKSTQSPLHQSDASVYSTQIIQNLANNHLHPQQTTVSSSGGGGGGGGGGAAASPNGNRPHHATAPSSSSSSSSSSSGGAATWAVAWNIHVYLSAILFTILAVYSIFKMIFYDKLTHLFNQSYFICIHLVLIVICLARIFFLCYDAYNIHASFHTFISELLLNLPATFLTISFAILILFLLIRSLNHKNNRYSALMRPLTVVVGSSVHVGLCITLHYVESTTTSLPMSSSSSSSTASGGFGGATGGHHSQQLFYQQNRASAASYSNGGAGAGQHHRNTGQMHHSAPRVLSLICQIIYIFVCLALGLFYLYVYRILKRILRNKSQNYIHGYQNLSYAIHITIATALLFILLAALQVYGAISISTTRPLISSTADIDWLQCGYQFSLRLIEIAIITLMSWVTGLKTGASKVLQQREKGMDTHNVSGFALFPCTSSSSQEHFESDYPAICNANTNLHTYTMRTGKPIYDDNFALNSLGMDNPVQQQQQQQIGGGTIVRTGNAAEFQVPNSNEFTRTYETNSARSSSHASEQQQQRHISDGEFLNDSGTMPDHYENPNFELRSSNGRDNGTAVALNHADMVLDNCYSEPLQQQQQQQQQHGIAGGLGPMQRGHDVTTTAGYDLKSQSNFDFQNFEKPTFDRPVMTGGGGGGVGSGSGGGGGGGGGTEFRASKNLKAMKNNNSNHLDRQQYDNPERRSSNSTHSYASGRNFNNLNYQSHHNSFERRGIRKSGTLNNIGGGGGGGGGGGADRNGGGAVAAAMASGVHGRGGASSTSSNSSNGGGRASGVQTLSSSSRQQQQQLDQHLQRNGAGRLSQQQQQQALHHKKDRHRSSIERSTAINHATTGGYMLPTAAAAAVDDLDYGNAGQMALPPSGRSFDTTSNASSDGTSSCNGGGSVHMSAGGGIRYQSDRSAAAAAAAAAAYKQHHHHMSQQSMGGGGGVMSRDVNGGGGGGGGDTQHSSSSGESATSGSMLVAEHGFVRFRAIDQQQQQQQQQLPSGGVIAGAVAAVMPQHPSASFRTTGRGKERAYTDS